MLYRTHHHPFLFPFNPFPSSSSNPLSPPLLSSPSLHQVVVGEQGIMECALKSSMKKPEMVLKPGPNSNKIQEGVLDDLCGVNGQNGDDFSVDDLLDFSNDPVEEQLVQQQPETEPKREEEQEQQEYKNTTNNVNNNNNHFCITDDFGSLSVPGDDLESLEWLSHFVEESFSGYSLNFDGDGKLPIVLKKEETRPDPESPVQGKAPFATPVQTKARTKRARGGGMRGWSFGSSSLTDSSSTSSSSLTESSSTTTSSSPPSSVYNPWVVVSQTAESVIPLPVSKKLKRKAVSESGGGGVVQQQPRRCSHCGVQKTPQWRAGPLGAKTLCNACGVRYKSGRLLPEYRPACSPTFSSELHSNNHRKVLEMRRKKEVDGSGLPPPVQSF